jgi:hypothetical protein
VNPVYLQICVALGNFLVTLLYVAWRKGKDDERLEALAKAHDTLAKDNKQLQDDLEQMAKDLNRLYGWLRGTSGAPINGGSH